MSGRFRSYLVFIAAASLGIASLPLVASRAGSSVSLATRDARAVLNAAIVPASAVVVHPSTPVVCQCAGLTVDPKYLVTMHRFYVVPGSPTSIQSFLASHVPKGGVNDFEGSSGAILLNSTEFPANGPHVYLRELTYTVASRNSTSSWLRVQSDVEWYPSRISSQLVTGAESATVVGYKTVALYGSTGATTAHISGEKLTRLLHVFNSLPLGPQSDCAESLTGFELTINLGLGGTVQVRNDFCGGPTNLVFARAGTPSGPRYSLSDTSCALIKEVVSLFGDTPPKGTRASLRDCQNWIEHRVS
ncbi:MAG: hypothetical protein WCF25_10180 [Acidimicrobiales bacterium]